MFSRFLPLKRIAGLCFGLFLFLGAFPVASAQLTLLPQASEGAECNQLIHTYEADGKMPLPGQARDDLLGCAIKTGRISLQMVPYFVTTMTNFLLAMVGIVCVLFTVIGGYYTIYGGITDNKEKGKKTIMHALLGMVIALLAWTIVNVIMSIVTS